MLRLQLYFVLARQPTREYCYGACRSTYEATQQHSMFNLSGMASIRADRDQKRLINSWVAARYFGRAAARHFSHKHVKKWFTFDTELFDTFSRLLHYTRIHICSVLIEYTQIGVLFFYFVFHLFWFFASDLIVYSVYHCHKNEEHAAATASAKQREFRNILLGPTCSFCCCCCCCC